ncbi:methionyl-tRNA formyltransferase [Siphonobacter sp. SORGH_AS_0500]|uniref:methionyl-tRNA formyltransferase n=1 Tax=Siphonobacter sp. SORGH_AS_0500 TaxID=1864824 RepID=UPI000CC3133B|nr:methionyl-tRNA formyltransferase [Siphonobacter sp. SORGH_AS_0500]PKK38137.1 methionyl-tRNA formyltransferase [Siphonobacter sp. SORGH_AS_0500]
MRIIFLGTPEFAVESLRVLVENQCNVVAVVTAPDKPAGRGQQLQQSPVKQYAVSAGIPVLQPEKLKNPEFLEELKSYQADLQVIVAFRMLPEVVWNMPRLGTFNLHASLLPQYRGAAPINWAIMNGETETGVTTFFLQHEIDTGPLIFQEKEPISYNDTVGEVYERLMNLGGTLVLKTVRAIESGEYPQIPQSETEEIKMAPKIFRETCEIQWNKPSEQVRNHIRGLSPYPAAWTTLLGKTCKIYRASVAEVNEIAEPGTYRTDHKTYLQFKTKEGWLAIDELQLEGKKRMGIEEFLRGMQGKL